MGALRALRLPFVPPVIFWVIGAAGVMAVARLIARESARINAELHPQSRELVTDAQAREGISRLKRDRTSGVYRPE
jgi:hypothetical protein